MASTSLIDRASSALKSNNKVLLRQIYNDLSAKISVGRVLTAGEHFPKIGKTLYRDIGTETAYSMLPSFRTVRISYAISYLQWRRQGEARGGRRPPTFRQDRF